MVVDGKIEDFLKENRVDYLTKTKKNLRKNTNMEFTAVLVGVMEMASKVEGVGISVRIAAQWPMIMWKSNTSE